MSEKERLTITTPVTEVTSQAGKPRLSFPKLLLRRRNPRHLAADRKAVESGRGTSTGQVAGTTGR